MIWWLGYSQYGSPRKRALVKDGPTSATSGCCPGFAPPGSYVCVRIGVGEKVSV